MFARDRGTPFLIETAARGVQFLLAIGIAYSDRPLVCPRRLDVSRYRGAQPKRLHAGVFHASGRALFCSGSRCSTSSCDQRRRWTRHFSVRWRRSTCCKILTIFPLCPGCQRAVDPEFVLCPHCQTHLRGPCPACARLIDLRWDVCPYCAVAGRPRGDRCASACLTACSSPGRVQRQGAASEPLPRPRKRVGIDGDEDLDALTDALSDYIEPCRGRSRERSESACHVGCRRWATSRDLRSGARGKAAQMGTTLGPRDRRSQHLTNPARPARDQRNAGSDVDSGPIRFPASRTAASGHQGLRSTTAALPAGACESRRIGVAFAVW